MAKGIKPPTKSTRGFSRYSDREINTMDPDAFAQVALEELSSPRPMLTKRDLEDIEASTTDGGNGMARRCVLVPHLKSGKELIEMIIAHCDVAVALADAVGRARAYTKHLRSVADLVDKATLRIELSLLVCDDAESVKAEAAH